MTNPGIMSVPNSQTKVPNSISYCRDHRPWSLEKWGPVAGGACGAAAPAFHANGTDLRGVQRVTLAAAAT